MIPVRLVALFTLACGTVPAADHTTLTGTVMCGYQGWFGAEGDGMGMRWQHYGFRAAGGCTIDLWPDVRELGKDERFDSPLKFADGRPAQVFSSANARTVQRHFGWMRDHGIDGVFLQRFGTVLKGEKQRSFADRVMENVRTAAGKTDRAWAVMYDLTGLRAGEIETVVMQDWKRLRNERRVIDDPAYLHHAGRPVVAVWGIGFNDKRDYTLDECAALLRFLRDNPEFGGMTVMAGVPFGWRTLDRDAVNDAKLHDVLRPAGIISPWAVGRYGSAQGAEREIGKVHEADAAWCREHKKDYLPVIFPGFSWCNLSAARGVNAKLNAIPRLGGQFFWSQAMQRIERGADMLYVAMFDEMDEGTAIFKCADEAPVGTQGFVTNDGLPADHYLWLTGQIGRVLRKEKPAGSAPPAR
ncbi:MAG: xylosidase/arabinosidase [Verrucomicrobiaceae bacterium]|nr:xylosidase/arabinosidase [Verrucomicrobiaceae bacterium]